MNRKINIVIIVCITCIALTSVAQKQVIKPDLSGANHFQVVNRDITISANDRGKVIVHLNGKPGDGIAWINNTIFKSGVIEFDAKGKNIMQQSFLGVAFHGLNDSTFDAVYFRPFNFQSPDTARRRHSIQYVSLPQFDWSMLRQNHPGKYENALLNPVNADTWFHAKILIENDNIMVYVNNDAKPSLVVKPLSDRSIGKIGFWVGNNSDGDFANLIITQ
jgi:hypothetical protein